MKKYSYRDMFVERNNYLVSLYDNKKKNGKLIEKIKAEVGEQLEKICDFNQYYKFI
jgi:hypothetical protein